jgi:hypothetical protein
MRQSTKEEASSWQNQRPELGTYKWLDAMTREFRIVGFIASGERVETDVKGAFTTFVGYPTLF